MFQLQKNGLLWGVLGGTVGTVPGAVGSTPEKDFRKVFYWLKTGGWDPRGPMPFRGDSNTHTTETPRSRAHI
jgi:hypothetical protein